MHKYIVLLIFVFQTLTPIPCISQVYNPFELTDRLEQNIMAGERVPKNPNNPFEITQTKPIGPELDELEKQRILKERFVMRERRQNNLEFWMILAIGFISALVISFNRSYLNMLIRAATNLNLLENLFRERKYFIGAIQQYYLIFLLNAAYLVSIIYSSRSGTIFNFQLYLTTFMLLLMVFLGKHILVYFCNVLIPLNNRFATYNFSIALYAILLGILTLPINILYASAEPFVEEVLVYVAMGATLLLYTLRYTNGVAIFRKFLPLHLFYFFLYLCTVEFAPVVLIRNFFLAIE
jgi:hypothetical protein